MKFKSRITKSSVLQLIVGTILLSGFFYACNPEKKIAKEFVYGSNKRNALVITPDFIYKINQKTWLLDSIKGSFSEEQKDSILWELSSYVKNIDDSIFLVKFSRGYNYQLAKYGFDVYTPEATNLFMEKDSNSYVIDIPQMELEETIYPYKDETMLNGYTYFHQHYLNAIDVSVWFEINKVNDTTMNRKTMFASDMLTDNLDGEFDYNENTDQLKYYYKIDTLTVNQIYDLSITLGKRYAQYTYDYLLNKYILSRKNPGDSLQYYWHYDLDRNKLYPIWDKEDRLIPVE